MINTVWNYVKLSEHVQSVTISAYLSNGRSTILQQEKQAPLPHEAA